MAYESITVTSGTLTATAWRQPDRTYGDGKTVATYMVPTGFGKALLLYFSGGTFYTGLGFYNFSGSSLKIGRAYDTVTLAFSDTISYPFPGISGGTGSIYGTSWSAQTMRTDVPLEAVSGYKTWWNYDLYAYVTDIATPSYVNPAWRQTATNTSDASGVPAAGQYLWSKSTPPAPDAGGWYMIQNRLLPGIESKMAFYPEVTRRDYYTDESMAVDCMSVTGMRETPEKYSTLANEWLVTNCTVTEEDGFYVVTTVYTGANSWSHWLYDESPLQPEEE